MRKRPVYLCIDELHQTLCTRHRGSCQPTADRWETSVGRGYTAGSAGAPATLGTTTHPARRWCNVYRGLPVRLHPTPVRRASHRGPPVGGNRGTAGGQAGELYQVKSSALIDTGSTSTLIKVGAIRTQGWEACVVPCSCVATTVSGPTPLRGKIVLSLDGLSGRKRSGVVLVMDWTLNEGHGNTQKSCKGRGDKRTGDHHANVIGPMSMGVSRKCSTERVNPCLLQGGFSRFEQEHGRHLERLLQRFKEFGLKALCEKSSFFNPLLKLMGHVLSLTGIHPNPGKVEAIRELQEEVDVKGVRSIMGLVGYYRCFPPSLADRMDGWNSLTKKGAKFVITEAMRETLEWAKTRLCEDPVLQFSDFPLTFIITTDASQVSVGAVLSQVDSGGGLSGGLCDLEPPGLGLLRRRAEKGPDLPAIPEAAVRMTPVSRPESERQKLLWKRGSLNEKVHQLSVKIVPGTDVHTSCHRYGRTRTWTVTIGGQATSRDVANPEEPIRLTVIDQLTRYATSYPLAAKTGEQVREALLLFLATVGIPGTLVLDQGREFRNIRVHWTTPGHPRSHGGGIEGDEAWARALLAYNNSMHSATGKTPLELMHSWQQTDPPVSVMDECVGLVEGCERRKNDCVDCANEKATDRWEKVQVGVHKRGTL
ncbi:hypothetical protein AAG570_012939 [Ranatra chinensis]|uniref:Integrase catalytic domain-containing protein n=1 Tax=Ranatra chinensis TaxID=642074 RepID=A0ABD0YFL6_9HEMI